jgi:hypothetical protein
MTMSSVYNLLAKVLALPSKLALNDDEQLRVNLLGDLRIAVALPSLAEIVRFGNSYQARTTTAAAPVAAIPTTAALISLWNGEADDGKSLVIDSVFAVTVASTTAQQTPTILGMLNSLAIPTAIAATITPISLLGNKTYGGRARVAVGTTVVDAGWFPFGTNAPQLAGATNNIGSCTDIRLDGLIIVPPKGQFNLSVLSAAATASSIQVGLRWHEIQL